MNSYYLKLQAANPEVAERYRLKLSAINNVDPFALDDSSFSVELCDFPTVTEMDVTVYLMITTSFYTPSQMKAYKSLEAYKHFVAGFVKICGSLKINDSIVLAGKFKDSQRDNDPLLKVWIICQKDGAIDSAHCTCMEGLSEVCTHVAAVLYAVDYILNNRKHRSCTDVQCMCNAPTTITSMVSMFRNIENQPLKSMSLNKSVKQEVPSMTPDEIVRLLQDFEDAGCSSALMRVVEPFASKIAEELKTRKTNT